MPSQAVANSCHLELASKADLRELMSWFDSAEATNTWAGPKFRFPFTLKTFLADCRWRAFDSFVLRREDGDLLAFGQIGTRYKRCHFARLVVNPANRGQGMGKALLSNLMAEARARYRIDEFGLFVYRHNAAALACYQSLGFVVTDYPDDAPLGDLCYYLIR